jgi:hypothetical protein
MDGFACAAAYKALMVWVLLWSIALASVYRVDDWLLCFHSKMRKRNG